MINKKNLRLTFFRYLNGLLCYSVAYLIYTQNIFYKGFISTQAIEFIKSLYWFYLFLGWPIQFLGLSQKHKPSIAVGAIKKIIANWREVLRTKLNEDEKVALLFFGVKFFYVPVMLNFVFSNWLGLKSIIETRVLSGSFSFNFRTDYVNLYSLIFTIDTLFFAFGYLVEHPLLKNVVKSVEPTALGWIVALASYPPFNTITAGYLNWFSNDYFNYQDPKVDLVIKIATVLLLFLYLWATLSLGFKSSNLTNRGIVTNGAYKYIRHPAYAGKVIAWWLMALPMISWPVITSLIGWTWLYYMRAITEERHLEADREYIKYKKSTPYRFVPGVI